MVPSGWIHTTFEKHIDLLGGFAFKSVNYSTDESDIKLLRGDNIEPGSLRWRGVKRWPRDESTSLEKYYLEEHDFVIAMDRTWISAGLKVAEVKKSDLPCLLVQRVSRIRALPTLEQSLLKQYFSGHRFEHYVKSVQTETAVPHISAAQIKEFSFLLPPLVEQRKIAKILSTWDKAITTTERLIDNSKQQKKALMQQLLTGAHTQRKRLLDDSGKPFEGEWEEASVEKLCDVGRGRVISKIEINENQGPYPVYSSQTMSDGVMGSIGTYDFEGDYATWTTDGVNAGTVFYRTGKFNCTNVCGTLKPKDTRVLDIKFLALALSLVTYKYVSHTLANPKLMNGVMKSVILSLPEIREQKKIASVLSVADKEIKRLEQQLADLKQEKKALMQQLLTGKRRVCVKKDENQEHTEILR